MDRISCEVVRDLLPLYVDDVCSAESRGVIAEHLSQCGDCREVERRIRDDRIISIVEKERESVLERHAKAERGAAWKAGTIFTGILMIPIIIVTAVYLFGGESDSLFGVLPMLTCAMLLAASLIAVPLMSKKNRLSRVILGVLSSILLIEFFGCLYEGDSFVQIGVPTLFGFSVPFLPIIINQLDMPETIAEHKLRSVIVWDMVWLILTILVAEAPYDHNSPFSEGMVVSVLLLIFAWTIFCAFKIVDNRISKSYKIALGSVTLILWVIFVSELSKMLGKGFLKHIISGSVFKALSLSSLGYYIALTGLGSVLFMGAVFTILGIVRRLIDE